MHKLAARTSVTSDFVAGRAFPVQTPALAISEEPLHGLIRLQAAAFEAKARTAIEAALQLRLPEPERFTSSGDVRLAWIGPNEWLAICPVESEAGFLALLRERLAGAFATITLISDSRICFRVSGADAAAFVSKGCAIDVEADHFAAGAVATTRFAGLPAMLLCRAVSDYALYFDVSTTGYVLDWLLDAAEEFRS